MNPFIVTLFHSLGITVLIFFSPASVMSYPPKPNTRLCITPPAPVRKQGLVPHLVSANTLKGFLRQLWWDSLKYLQALSASRRRLQRMVKMLQVMAGVPWSGMRTWQQLRSRLICSTSVMVLSGQARRLTSACLMFQPLQRLCSLVTLLGSFRITIFSEICLQLSFGGSPSTLAAELQSLSASLATALVKALSSTFSAHSSAATTFLMWQFPSSLSSTLLSQNSATEASILKPLSSSHCLSCVTAQQFQAAKATHPLMWCSSGPDSAQIGVSQMPSFELSHGYIAPRYPLMNALFFAASSRSKRYSIRVLAKSGLSPKMPGQIQRSMSQKTCPLQPSPLSPMGLMPQLLKSLMKAQQWYSISLTFFWSSQLPSITMSLRHSLSHSLRCASTSGFSPMRIARSTMRMASLTGSSWCAEEMSALMMPKRQVLPLTRLVLVLSLWQLESQSSCRMLLQSVPSSMRQLEAMTRSRLPVLLVALVCMMLNSFSFYRFSQLFWMLLRQSGTSCLRKISRSVLSWATSSTEVQKAKGRFLSAQQLQRTEHFSLLNAPANSPSLMLRDCSQLQYPPEVTSLPATCTDSCSAGKVSTMLSTLPRPKTSQAPASTVVATLIGRIELTAPITPLDAVIPKYSFGSQFQRLPTDLTHSLSVATLAPKYSLNIESSARPQSSQSSRSSRFLRSVKDLCTPRQDFSTALAKAAPIWAGSTAYLLARRAKSLALQRQEREFLAKAVWVQLRQQLGKFLSSLLPASAAVVVSFRMTARMLPDSSLEKQCGICRELGKPFFLSIALSSSANSLSPASCLVFTARQGSAQNSSNSSRSGVRSIGLLYNLLWCGINKEVGESVVRRRAGVGCGCLDDFVQDVSSEGLRYGAVAGDVGWLLVWRLRSIALLSFYFIQQLGEYL